MNRVRVVHLVTTIEFGGIERVLLTQLEHREPDVELSLILFTRSDARERALSIACSSWVCPTKSFTSMAGGRNI